MAPLDKCEAMDSAAAPAASKSSRESAPAPGVEPDSGQAMILTYHEVWPKSSAYLYSVTTSRLEAHLELIQAIRNAGSSEEVRVPRVTFDDGHISAYQHALRLLEKYSLPAVFFVTAGSVEARQEIMGWPELREVVSLGHEVQSHGWSHAHLTQCTDAELSNELERSKRTLEDRLGIAVDALSFPGGRWNARVLAACARTGYRRVYASQPWLRRREGEGLELRGRLMVRRTMEVRHLEELFRGSSFAMLRLRARNALGVSAKLFLGDYGYLRLWRALARKQERQNDRASSG